MVTEGFFMVFQGSRLVFHGFRCVLFVIQGSRVIFHGTRWVLWFFKVPGWLFIIPGRFLWSSRFQLRFSWFQVCLHRFSLRENHGSRLVFIVTGWFLFLQVSFSLFLVAFHCFSWLLVGFSWFQVGF